MEVASDVGVFLGGLDLQTRVLASGYAISSIKGWDEPTASTGQVTQRQGASGGWLDEAESAGRRLVVAGSIDSDSHSESVAMLRALWRALPVKGVTPFVVVENGAPLYAMVRQEDKPDTDWLTDTYVTFNFQLHSKEYRRFSGDGSGPSYSQTVGLPRTQGGRVRPYVLPSRINATVVSGSVDVVNAGNAPAPVVVRFDGPVSSPAVRMPDGQWMSFALDVLPGQELTVDFDAHTVRLNGVDRRASVRGRWLVFGPGANTLIFDAASYVEAARMTVSWSDSWK